jgi:hypothetical protein
VSILSDIGCREVRFIPSAKDKQTPDLEGVLNGMRVLCEVKTIQISEDEAQRQQTGSPGTTQPFLTEDFFGKLRKSLRQAQRQLESYYASEHGRRMAFIVVNFDDSLGDYKANYYAQIDQWLAANPIEGIEIVFYNQRTAFHPHITMQNAVVVNEA